MRRAFNAAITGRAKESLGTKRTYGKLPEKIKKRESELCANCGPFSTYHARRVVAATIPIRPNAQ
jgi:hypothetical protein